MGSRRSVERPSLLNQPTENPSGMFKPLVAVYMCIASGAAMATDGPHIDVSAFVKANCLDCHAGKDAEAGLQLQDLSTSLNNQNVDTWIKVIDRVKAGEMPPPEYADLSSKSNAAFIESNSLRVKNFQREKFAKLGRVPARRLTNLQLERTLQDLLGIDIPLATQMPDEPRTHGFNTVASGQSISHFQLQTHLSVVDAALDEAFRRAFSEPDEWSRTFSPRQIARQNPRRRCREPEMLNGKAVVWSTRTTFYGRLPVTTARANGWYRINIKTSALNPPESGGVWATVRTGQCVSSSPQFGWAGAFEATKEPGEWTFDAWMKKGDMFEIRPGDQTARMANFQGGQVGAGEGEPQNVQGIAHHELTLQRIHVGPDDDAIRKLLIDDLAWKRGRDEIVQLTSRTPKADAQRLVRRFASRAFRRPVEMAELKPFVEIVLSDLDDGVSMSDALRTGYRAILCSPRFMYFEERPGSLDTFALATRLSYMLWNSMPDWKLRTTAADKSLLKPEVLQQQVNRMLRHPRGRSFVKDFAHQWLDLSEIDFTEPDRKLYRGFDVIVQESMLRETHAFLQEMIDGNLPVTNLIDSDFTFLNSRLARHYDIPGVMGDRLQRVSLKPEYNRGGVLTQGAVLKVTANGSATSPVLRGVWIADRLLGHEIPPPPDSVPAIEPDIRGAKSIRDMLEKHKSDSSCASCHRMIDPPGFALENFDPAGKWRDTYSTSRKSRKSAGDRAIDAGYTMANGDSFKDLRGFRQLVLRSPEAIAANVARQLITYGTGSPCQFADRDEVESIVASTARDNYGMRSLVHAVVNSQIFRTK